MPIQNSIFQKPIFKVLSLIFAFIALTVSILFSQNNSDSKKDKKKEKPTIFNSSKSGLPIIKDKQKEEAPAQSKEQTNPNEEPKPEEKKSEPKKDKPESNTKMKKNSPIMPSSKAPDPEQY